MRMTKYDIKHYLEKIYKVPVAYVTTEVKLSVNRNPHQISSEAVAEPDIYFHPVRDKMRQTTKWSEEYKLARVTLGEGQTFDYPNLESKIPNLVEKVQEGADKEDERIKEKVKNTAYVPNWFK